MKVTAFLGSPRAGGNTDTLALHLLDGASEIGLETEAVPLRKLKIRPCIGCEQCWAKGRPCVFTDDMSQLYETIAGSDILVFATPVYWYAPTTYMKALMDRLVPLNRPLGRHLIQDKSAILISAYEEEGPTAVEPLIRIFELSFQYLGLKWIDSVIVDGVGPKGAILEKTAALDRAYDIGRGLKESPGK